jgi:hypothetical protein
MTEEGKGTAGCEMNASQHALQPRIRIPLHQFGATSGAAPEEALTTQPHFDCNLGLSGSHEL